MRPMKAMVHDGQLSIPSPATNVPRGRGLHIGIMDVLCSVKLLESVDGLHDDGRVSGNVSFCCRRIAYPRNPRRGMCLRMIMMSGV